jgi:CHAT domain-containing protein/tetratricopeptide (TPR) repeat protein
MRKLAMNSYAEEIPVYCATCQLAFQGKLWLIVDTTEKSALVERIKRGKLHRVVCPDCGQMVAEPDKPLLLYQPDANPVLLFSPAEGVSPEEELEDIRRLVRQLQQDLAGRWQDSWLESGVDVVTRSALPEEMGRPRMRTEDTPVSELPSLETLMLLLQQFEQLDRSTDHPQRIQFLQQALTQIPRVGNPQISKLWAVLQVELGNSYLHYLQGDRAENLEQAIAAYQQVLTVVNRQVMPVEWAQTMHNLASAYYNRIRGDRAENLEQAIECDQQALIVRTKQAMPVEWAMTTVNLSSTYSDRIRGDRAENLEQAIAGYRQALTVITQQEHPVEWAQTINNLATAYYNRIRGDRAENLEQAIDLYGQALTMLTQQEELVEGAKVTNNLANAYYFRIRGDKAENIELAIEYCQQALTVRTEQAMPFEWAMTMNNLANAYRSRIRGSKAENIELAIDIYQQALTVRKKQAMSFEWAETMNNLALAYSSRIREDEAENIEQAIEYCQQALTVITEQAMPVGWAQTINNLANAYCDRIRGDKAENIELAIECYKKALTVRTKQAMPFEWAEAMTNLAIAYRQRVRGDRAENVEQAIVGYRQVLTVTTQQKNPGEWSRIMHNLATAYSFRIQGDRAENIEQAIDACQQALTVRTKQAMPVEWAMTMNTLATAYLDRIRGDRAESLERAINLYRQALTVRTKQAMPVEWAQSVNNLANAYCDRIRGNEVENLERAIARYRRALTVSTKQANPVEWARTMMNLATAYLSCIRGNRAENIENAIDVCQQALTVRTKQAMPLEWAEAMHNLALAYFHHVRGDKAENIENAIEYCQQALTVRTRQTMPVEWAQTMHNLANAYSKRIRGDKAENIENAIAAYRQTLTVFTPHTNPHKCLDTARTLGNLHFTQGNWQRALAEGYKIAIQAVEQTRTWASSDDRRQEVLEHAIGVYENALQCYINLEQYQEAILLTEQSRSRHLVDLMYSNDLYRDGNIPPEIQQYLEEYEALQQQINQLRQQQRNDSALSGTRLQFTLQEQTDYTGRIENLLQQKETVWRKLRAKDPVLAEQLEIPHLDCETLAQLIANQPTTAILSFYSTNDDTYIFVVRYGKTGITCNVHICQNQGKQKLQFWVAENWLVPYKTNFRTWTRQISQQLQELSQNLQLDQLISSHLQDIEELILAPHIFLHLIPFAALPLASTASESQPQYLGDRFRLRVLPSIQILKYCHNRETNGLAPTVPGAHFGTVEDATGDRPIIASGFEPIAQRLQIPNEQRLRGSQQATLTNYKTLARNPIIQALHSIHHAESDLETPLDSALLLANQEPLTLGQLLSPGWRMPHLVEVFLSCCETNLGNPNLTDDIITLSAGFLCAGARSVVSTLWSVDALATVLFCNFYYEFRQTGSDRPASDRPTALQQAQQRLRQLSGTELAALQLDQQLEQQQDQAETQRRSIERQRARLPAEHPDHDRLKRESEECDRLYQEIGQALKQLAKYQEAAHPFESPYYWAGFVSQGLR